MLNKKDLVNTAAFVLCFGFFTVACAASRVELLPPQHYHGYQNSGDLPLDGYNTGDYGYPAGSRIKRFYLEANAGTNLYYLALFAADKNVSHGGFQGFGWSGALGFSWNESFALELGFMQNYAKFNAGNNSYVSGHTNVSYLTTRFILPFVSRINFISKLGLMYASASASATHNNERKSAESPDLVLPYIGLGIGYTVSPQLDINLQYQGAVYGVAGAGLFSLGLTHYFT